LPTSALFHNVNGEFVDVSVSSGAALPMRGNGCVAADLDRNGFTDIYITTERVNMLLWNNGNGTFREGAAAARVDEYGWQTAVVAGDLNRDGWLDLFVAGYVDINNPIPGATMGFPNTHLGRRDFLYLNQGIDETGQVTFREVGELVGLETADYEYGLGALFTDMDNDGDLDLYIANDTNPNRLYENIPMPDDPEGIGFRLREVGAAAQVNDSNSGMGVTGGDYDGDGRFDLFITNMGAQLHTLHRNETAGIVPFFADGVSSSDIPNWGEGWTGWGTSWGDVDTDGDLDLLVANGAIPILDPQVDAQLMQLFVNLTAQGQTAEFLDLSGPAGLAEVGPLLGRGAAMADYDNDGDLDVAVNSIGGPLTLLQNVGAKGNWLTVQLGDGAVGATVTAVLPDGRQLSREIHAGSSYLSSEDPRLHFGLGTADTIAELYVSWPYCADTRLQNITVNQHLLIVKQP
jgi:hypothetical protein